jgi:hypothetical protein
VRRKRPGDDASVTRWGRLEALWSTVDRQAVAWLLGGLALGAATACGLGHASAPVAYVGVAALLAAAVAAAAPSRRRALAALGVAPRGRGRP